MEEKREFAIISSGNKQYRVCVGDIIDVELVEGAQAGPIEFREVLLCSTGKGIQVGSPLLSSVLVKGELLENVRGPKVLNYKYKKRKNYRRKVGHRQDYNRVKITEIAG